jgi:hypothetical protein
VLPIQSGCSAQDPASTVQLAEAPPGTRTFFGDGIKDGVLYSYITRDAEIFVYRRDLNKFGWASLTEFRQFVLHAKGHGGYLVYTLEDGDLQTPECQKAFDAILDAEMNTQDPIDLLPLVQQELAKRRGAEQSHAPDPAAGPDSNG